MSATIWCVVPFSRPQNLELVRRQFISQSYQNKKLVIVENGSAIGSCKRAGFEPDLLLTSRTHQSYAKNEALLALKEKHGDDYWTTTDDDDYYGPGYLEELAQSLGKGEVIGKSRSFIRLSDGRLYLIDKWAENELGDSIVHGPTITARIKDSLLFQVEDWGEDLDWAEEMKRLGARVYSTSRYNWCYFRSSDGEGHAWCVSDNEIRFANSGAMVDYGPFNADIVNGVTHPSGEVVYCNEFDIEGSAMYLKIMKETGGDEFTKDIVARIEAEYAEDL
jgi:glycosyltransferase involved in cell wall biosynthesis